MSEYNSSHQDVKSDIHNAAKSSINVSIHHTECFYFRVDLQQVLSMIFGDLTRATRKNCGRKLLSLIFTASFMMSLLLWKYPRASLLIFLSLLSTILAFRFINVMRYIFKAAYLLLGSVASLEYGGKVLGYKGVVSQMRPRRYHTIPRESVESIFEEIHDFLNFVVVEFQRIVFVENIVTTFATFFTSFFGYFLIKYLPFWSLAFLGTIAVFTGPYIYINNQEQVDALINHYSEIANSKLHEARGVTEQYAGEYANRARQTASQLTEKVQNYTNRRASGDYARPIVHPRDFPNAPTHEPISPNYQEQRTPIVA